MKLEKREEARNLRIKGLSINQIADALDVSKGSVSIWVRDVALSNEAMLNINNRFLLGRVKSRESRLANILKFRTVLNAKCERDILPLSFRDLWIAGVMLYAGEGRKVWNVSSQAVELTNSDPNILRVFISFLTKICNVLPGKIRIRLFLYPDISQEKARDYWSKELNIPISQFQKPFIKNSYSKPSRVRRSEYGTVHVVLQDAVIYRKILGWLKAVYSGVHLEG